MSREGPEYPPVGASEHSLLLSLSGSARPSARTVSCTPDLLTKIIPTKIR